MSDIYAKAWRKGDIIMAYDMYGNWIPTPLIDIYAAGMQPPFGGFPAAPFTPAGMYGGARTVFAPPIAPIAPYGPFGFNPYAAPYTVPVNDDDIRMDVEDNIAADWVISRKDFENIKVEVEDGIVTLSGEVSDRRTKHHAYSVAFWTPGVVDVINNLTVREEREKGRERERGRPARRGEYTVAARTGRSR